ncbi:MAG: amidase family protein [Halolamina sp.]|uniref:amidase n=1 Tax=Halolamina sp. TaxID=1940283 RepID=UPI002FC31413
MTEDIVFRPATELAADIRDRELSPVTVVDAFLDRIDEREEKVNAWITLARERAREQAHEAERAVERGDDLGPLHGVPVAIKDLTELNGVGLTYGTPAFADHVAQRDAVAVQRLKEAGAIPLGKTNTPEFGLRVVTDNQLVGPTATPFDPERNSGGSSGGSAAAVAAGMAPLAEGSDAGGSIRIPASFCHAVGIKPTYGRVPVDSRPNAFGSHTPMTHKGPIARTVEDAATMLDVLAGAHPRDPFSIPDSDEAFAAAVDRDASELSVGYSPNLGIFPIDSRVESGVERAVDGLRGAGLTVEEVEVDLGHTLEELIEETSVPMWEAGIAALAERLEETAGVEITGEHADQFPPHVTEMAESGTERSAVEYLRADEPRTEVYDGVEAALEGTDLLVCPVTTVPPFEHGIEGPSEVAGTPVNPESGWFLTSVFNLTGHPAASVPAGLTDEGLPVGVQIVGHRHAEADVIAAAATLEREHPWHDDYPGATN